MDIERNINAKETEQYSSKLENFSDFLEEKHSTKGNCSKRFKINTKLVFYGFLLIPTTILMLIVVLSLIQDDHQIHEFIVSDSFLIKRIANAAENENYKYLGKVLLLDEKGEHKKIDSSELEHHFKVLKEYKELKDPDFSVQDYFHLLIEKQYIYRYRKTFLCKPIAVLVSSNLPNIKLFINDRQLWTTKKDVFYEIFNDFLPFPIKVSSLNPITSFAPLNDKFIDPLMESFDQRLYVGMPYVLRTLRLASSVDGSVFCVNNKATEIVISKTVNEYGPVELQGENQLYAYKKYPWGNIFSQEIQMKLEDADREYYFHLYPLNKKLEQSIFSLIHQFNSEYSRAFNNLDSSIITTTTVKKSTYIKNQIDEFYIRQKRNIFLYLEKYRILEHTLELTEAAGTYKVKIDVQEEYWEAKWHQNQSMPNLKKNKLHHIRYFFVYDQNQEKWLIDDWEIIENY